MLERIEALAKELNIPAEDIKEEEYGHNTFEIQGDSDHSGEEWMVLTEEEADIEARESVKNTFDDLGLESFTKDFQKWILDNCIDEDWFEEVHRDDCYSLIEEYDYEEDDEFGTRLVRELYDAGLLTEDDFEVNDEDEPDFSKLLEDVDTDALKDELVEHMMGWYNNSVEWFTEVFGVEELTQVARKNPSIIDLEKVADECVDLDGRGHFISFYNGEEVELAEDGRIIYYAYRLN